MTLTPRRRFRNLLQSTQLPAGMAVIGWFVVSAIAGQAMALAIAIGPTPGLLPSPGTPKRLLRSACDAHRLSGRKCPEGIAMLAGLAHRAGLPRVPELCHVPGRLRNAIARGSPDECAAGVSDGLLHLRDRRKRAGVLAHEVAHTTNHDLGITGLAGAMSRAATLACWLGQMILLVNLPLVLARVSRAPRLVPRVAVLSPTIMALLQLALSPTRECDADRGEAELTGHPRGPRRGSAEARTPRRPRLGREVPARTPHPPALAPAQASAHRAPGPAPARPARPVPAGRAHAATPESAGCPATLRVPGRVSVAEGFWCRGLEAAERKHFIRPGTPDRGFTDTRQVRLTQRTG